MLPLGPGEAGQSVGKHERGHPQFVGELVQAHGPRQGVGELLERNQLPGRGRAYGVLDGRRLAAAVAVLEVHELVGERAPPLGLRHAGVEPDHRRAIGRGWRRRVWAGPDHDDVRQRAQRPPGVEHATIVVVGTDTVWVSTSWTVVD